MLESRGIQEVLHFTTNLGLTGILASRAIKSRKRIEKEEILEFILKPNVEIRKDPTWEDHISLSVTQINSNFFDYSKYKHPEVQWWCILSLDPAILTHEGVVFVTTNNIYPSARRGYGPSGFEQLFAPVVNGRYSERLQRSLEMPASFTTCDQAEVLYPGELSIEYLRTIYVAAEEDGDDVTAQFSALNLSIVDIAVAPERFNREMSML